MVSSYVQQREVTGKGNIPFDYESQARTLSAQMFISLDHEEIEKYRFVNSNEKQDLPSEMICHEGNIIILYTSGLCCFATEQEGYTIRVLNSSIDEIWKSIFLNKVRKELVYVSECDDQWSLNIIPLQSVRNKTQEAAIIFCDTRHLSTWPSFFQFDEINHVMICHYERGALSTCSVIDLFTWRQKYSLPACPGTIRLSEGMIVMAEQKKKEKRITIFVYSVDDGALLQSLLLYDERVMEFVIPFQEVLLVKFDGSPLLLYSFLESRFFTFSEMLPIDSVYIVPLKHSCFVSHYEDKTSVWTTNGHLLKEYENTSDIQNLFVSLRRDCCISHHIQNGCFLIRNLFTGELLRNLRLSFPLIPQLCSYDTSRKSLYLLSSMGLSVFY